MFKVVSTNESIENLSKLAFDIWFEYYENILSNDQIEYMLNKYLSVDAIKSEYLHLTYVMIHDKEDIGFFVYQMKDEIFLSKLYIKKSHREKGYGKKVMDFLKQFDKPITLTVNKHNHDAIHFYQTHGLIIVKEVVTDIGSGYVMDDYILRWAHV